MISLSAPAIDSPGTEVATPWAPALTKFCTSFSWPSGALPACWATFSVTPRSLAAAWAPSMICWMNGSPCEWVTKPTVSAVQPAAVLAVSATALAASLAVMFLKRMKIPPGLLLLLNLCSAVLARERRAGCQAAVRPPSTNMNEPVMYEASSEARNATAPAISTGSAPRFSGMFWTFHS